MADTAKLENASVFTKANIYFDGKVVSHTVLTNSGEKKTIGLIYPGSYTFGTGAPERMDMVAGICKVRLKGSDDWNTYGAGSYFVVPGNSSFDIAVEDGIAEYLCSYL